MDVNGISQAAASYEAVKPDKATEQKSSKKGTSTGTVYDGGKAVEYKKDEKKSSSTVKYDKATIEKMKAEADLRTSQLRSLVEKMLLKQGQKFTTLSETVSMIENGTIKVDPSVSADAAKEIADDGYWGVEQTSERLFSFAKALSGNDPAHADTMMAAIKKGYEQATKSWGKDLPDICQRTLDSAMDKLTKWKEASATTTETSDAAEEQA